MADQPMPVTGKEDVTPLARTLFLEMLKTRERRGIETYGMTLQTHNGRDPFQDALEELIDGWQYLVQASLECMDALRDIKRLTAERDRLRTAITEALEDYDRRDELGMVDRLRAAVATDGVTA